jgi:hypothetical protein
LKIGLPFLTCKLTYEADFLLADFWRTGHPRGGADSIAAVYWLHEETTARSRAPGCRLSAREEFPNFRLPTTPIFFAGTAGVLARICRITTNVAVNH